MNLHRINELRIELAEERVSYGELAEIESAYGEMAQNDVVECIMAGDMLDLLEEDFHEREAL